MHNLQISNKVNSYLTYKYTLKKLQNFTGDDLHPTDITHQWLDHFTSHLKNTGISETSIGIYLRNLRHILHIANNMGLIAKDDIPFGKGQYSIYASQNRKMALTIKQIKAITTYQDANKNIEEYRDLWYFSYLCNGINFADMLYLKYGNIQNGEIVFKRSKTKHISSSPYIRSFITPEMYSIISKWGNRRINNETYIFRHAKDNENEWQRSITIKTTIKQCNRALNKIGLITGIGHISTYTARHSFATILKRNGINITFISESLGHTNIRTTMSYLDSFEKEDRMRNSKYLTDYND